jgi:ubiquinone/menaquinone biosynthesis C-methylase UbiE
MHALPFEAARFDAVLLMSALPYARNPAAVMVEAARVLRPGGLLVGATLRAHEHQSAVARYNHVNQGFEPEAVSAMLTAAGLAVELCDVTSTERRLPHFEVVTFHARKA